MRPDPYEQIDSLLNATGLDRAGGPDQAAGPFVPLPQQIAAIVGVAPPEAEGLPANIGELRMLIRTMLGQPQMPTGQAWPMSMNRSATRLNLLEPRVALLEQLVQQYAAGASATDVAVKAITDRLELMRAAQAISDGWHAADQVRFAALEAKDVLIASATEANRLDIVALRAADVLLQAQDAKDAQAITAAQATADRARVEASLAQKKADDDAAALLVLQGQLATVQQTAAATAASLATVAADVATRLPSLSVQRFTVTLPAVTIQVLTPYVQAVALPKAFPSANYLVFLDKANSGLLNTELGDRDKTAAGFNLTARNTGAVSLAMPGGVAEVLAILIS